MKQSSSSSSHPVVTAAIVASDNQLIDWLERYTRASYFLVNIDDCNGDKFGDCLIVTTDLSQSLIASMVVDDSLVCSDFVW